MTEGRVHESRVARGLRFEPGAIVIFDRGYTDYAWFTLLDPIFVDAFVGAPVTSTRRSWNLFVTRG